MTFWQSLFQLFSELNRLSTQDWGKEHYLTSLNLQTNQLNVWNMQLLSCTYFISTIFFYYCKAGNSHRVNFRREVLHNISIFMDSQLTIKFVPLKNSHYNMVVLIIHLYLILTILQEYTYDFEVMQNPLRTYQLVSGATGAMLTEKVIFVISHDDEQNQCAVSISIIIKHTMFCLFAQCVYDEHLFCSSLSQ